MQHIRYPPRTVLRLAWALCGVSAYKFELKFKFRNVCRMTAVGHVLSFWLYAVIFFRRHGGLSKKKFVWSSINLHMSYETNGHGHWNCTRTQPMNFFGMAWHGTARPGTRKTRFTCHIRFHSIPYSSYSFIHTSISFCCS